MSLSEQLRSRRLEIVVTFIVVACVFLITSLLPAGFVERLFAADYMPHGHCYLWEPSILWLHVGSDALVALSYFTIPLCIVLLVRRRRGLRFRGVFWLFSLFILFCGLTHVLEIYSVWYGAYRLTGTMKLATAIVSVATAIYLVRSLPTLITLPLKEDFQEVEFKLRERNTLFQAILSDGLEAFVVLKPIQKVGASDISFVVEEFNELAAKEMSGKNKILAGLNIEQAFPSAGQFGLVKLLKGCLESKRPHHSEYELREKGAIDRRWISVKIIPTGSQLALFLMDVSKDRLTEKRFQQTLEESVSAALTQRDISAARAEAAMSAAAHGILVVDSSGGIVQCNEQLLQFFGYTKEELIGKPVETLVPMGARDRHEAHMDSFNNRPSRRAMGGAIKSLSGLRKDGTTFPVEIGLNPFETPEGKFVCASVVDITDRLEARAALRESELLLQQATSGGNVGIWHWFDITEDKLYWSPKMYELLGFAPEELDASYENFKSLLHPDDLKPTLEALKNCFGDKSHFTQDQRLLTKKRGYRWFYSAGQLVEDESTGKTKMVGSIMDIQKRKDHEQEVERINESLAVKNQEMEQMTYAVSHDLKAPLVSILGLSNLLRIGEFKMDEDANGLLNRIEKAAGHMQTLINDMLEMSKVGSLDGEHEEVQTLEVLGEVRELFEADIKSSRCDLRIDIGIPPIWTRPILLRQAVQNLLANALKYGCTSEHPIIEVFSRRNEKQIDLIVQDNGNGIPEANRADVFKLFRRLNLSVEGSGLGLAIVAKIMGTLKGRAFVEEHDGPGARFVLRFPLREVSEGFSNERVVEEGPRLVFSDEVSPSQANVSEVNLSDHFKKFVYATAHDFNAPLITIKGHLSFLLQHGADGLSEDFRKLVEQSSKAANRMTEYLEALVNYGEAILDDRQREKEKLDLGTLVEQTLKEWRKTGVIGNVSLIRSQLPEIDAIDKGLIKTLFENLLDNAIRFASESDTPEVELAANETATHWTFSIQDNGPGLASSDALSAFAPFGRLGLQEVSKAGIGLATCKMIVELHGGQIWIDPDYQKGAMIHFTIRKG
ncbi:ATP-binding protein [Pelagicoccus sp. SDUM812002]|uniref:ATP-binding protein n=1 Tax=Pelagicoccus sp. SDUM812002 TaxID=3041266 RepID=UPI00280F10E3|nr:ATP-binding protein [Pelagicoccus sp. SDUM812002]MDQ8187755.1 ATP-binding protein [Pelagicoccus sp. SDUM812002]